MFGLQDKVIAMAGGALSLILAGSLAFVWIGKNAEIRSLKDSIDNPETGYVVRLERAQTDLTQCRSNRITLEEATRRQNSAVEYVAQQAEEREARLAAELEGIKASEAKAKARADRILASRGTGDACWDADQLILEEIGQ